MATLKINPPLINSANPWCSELGQLQDLYNSPYTGAVTTRTSMQNPYPNSDSIHQFAFFNPTTHAATPRNPGRADYTHATGSLNTFGYSPHCLAEYLSFIKTISDSLAPNAPLKPFIVSVTGTVDEVVLCYRHICAHQQQVRMPLAVEINLSCPNIVGKPPPAYDAAALLTYLAPLKQEIADQRQRGEESIPIGIKTPPYTYHDQFAGLISALVASAKDVQPREQPCPVSFITACNTLGSSLVLSSDSGLGSATALASANGTGIGGMAGAPLHPLALGNVRTIKTMLAQHGEELGHVMVIGVGGVEDGKGFRRMRGVGADVVGVGTALGRKGVVVFEEIGREVGGGGKARL